jgi:hypothetical protein
MKLRMTYISRTRGKRGRETESPKLVFGCHVPWNFQNENWHLQEIVSGEFIMPLISQTCESPLSQSEMREHLLKFLRYAAIFLSNIGTYYVRIISRWAFSNLQYSLGRRGRKFVLDISEYFLRSIGVVISTALELCR